VNCDFKSKKPYGTAVTTPTGFLDRTVTVFAFFEEAFS
jgi:hypothetical protein